MVSIAEEYIRSKSLINQALLRYLPASLPPHDPLLQAMRYSLLSKGKRLRPALALFICHAFGKPFQTILPAACALEYVHTYSLIHDDLPCMDNDALRRGKPTNHKVFGEALAILAGDALLTLSFDVIAQHTSDPALARQLIHILAHYAGASRLLCGQVMDLNLAQQRRFPSRRRESFLLNIYEQKTSSLFMAAGEIGAVGAHLSSRERKRIVAFGKYLGLAFQIQDDLEEKEKNEPFSYPRLFGEENACEAIRRYREKGERELVPFQTQAPLLRNIYPWLLPCRNGSLELRKL